MIFGAGLFEPQLTSCVVVYPVKATSNIYLKENIQLVDYADLPAFRTHLI
jgi:hypothetical protein